MKITRDAGQRRIVLATLSAFHSWQPCTFLLLPKALNLRSECSHLEPEMLSPILSVYFPYFTLHVLYLGERVWCVTLLCLFPAVSNPTDEPTWGMLSEYIRSPRF